MAAIFQTTFFKSISWMKKHEFCLRFHWSLFLRVQLTIFHHWFRLWLGADQATSHFLERWWPCLLTHMCVTRPQWVKSTSLYINITMFSMLFIHCSRRRPISGRLCLFLHKIGMSCAMATWLYGFIIRSQGQSRQLHYEVSQITMTFQFFGIYEAKNTCIMNYVQVYF